jgi:DNA helicase-2/ATP-dependent DNA helicase PcrA
MDFLAGLNPEQRAVVENGDGPCVVLAGAGSGKTRTIVHRVAHLIANGVPAERILLLTFTNKAAAEMMHRIGDLLGSRLPGGTAGVWGGTFHSIANRFLRVFAAQAGFSPSFSILDEEDARDLMKAAIRELGLAGDGKRFPAPGVIKEVLSFSLNAMMPLEEALAVKHPKFEPLLADIRNVVETYDAKKRKANTMDFDDLLVRLHHLLERDVTARERIAGRFTYLLVDEYQDTNPLQAAIVRLLAGAERNVLVVGDDAQSIYSFRAADVRNILDFPKQWPDARIFRLETNYRSTPEVLALANDVIAKNVEQFPKELKSVKPSGAKPAVVPTGSAAQEAGFVAERIERLIDEGTSPQEIAVLFRATFHSQALEFELMKRGLEYDYRGGVKFFERAHVKDALAFLRIAANFQDEAAWLRVLSLQQGVGDATAGKIFAMMRAAGSLAAATLAPVEAALGARAARGWKDLRDILSRIHEAGEKPAALVRVVAKSAYADYLENQYPNWKERLEDVEQLATFAENYDRAADLLAEVALDDSALKGAAAKRAAKLVPKVVLSTIHQAKGLEWDTVFLIHLTNSSFPNRKAALEEGGLEEERRLFYVAVTRAKRHLYLCWPAATGRDMFGMEQPSSFLEEADPKHLDLGLVERSGWASGSVGRGSSKKADWDDSDSGGFFEDDAVDMDAPQDPFAGVKGRMKKVNEDWKKKSFLRDI